MKGLIHDLIENVAYPLLNDGGMLAAVTHEAYDGVSYSGWGANEWGESADWGYNAGVSRNVLLEHRQKKVVNVTGNEVLAEHKISILDDVSVDPRDRFTFPDGTQPIIASIESLKDDEGSPYMVEIWFTKTR